jgi:LPXTG-motif cell wall-anchored protein
VPTYRLLREKDKARYLLVPDELPSRVHDLARTWTAETDTPLAQATAIQRHLRTEFRYDLSSPSGKADQPLDHFLFESKRGHCEYYSTAMAVMLRVVGVPSRNVTGFVGATYNRFGEFYAVRQGDAHSWVEAYIAGRGWLTFDPTPPAAATPLSEIEGTLASVRDLFEAVSQRWNQHALGYDLRQQVGLLDSLQARSPMAGRLLHGPRWRQLLALAGILLVAGGVYYYRRRRRLLESAKAPGGRPASKEAAIATSLYELLDRAMLTMGLARSATTPPLRHAESLVRRDHPQAGEILDLTRRYLAARFGDQPLSTRERKAFEHRVLELRTARSESNAERANAATGEA